MIKQGTSKVKFMIGSSKVKALMLGTEKVWSGASLVSYYDGTTLLGTEEVEEGNDVLHPSISTSKPNYTLVGWSTTTSIDNFVTNLTATGEPMTLYAMYLPNTITIGQVVRNGESFNTAIKNTDYITGDLIVSGGGTPYISGWAQWDESRAFTFNKGLYQHSSITIRESNIYAGSEDNVPHATGYFDGTSVGGNNSSTFTDIANGTHTLRNAGRTWDEQNARLTQTGATYVTSFTLSDPTPWV